LYIRSAASVEFLAREGGAISTKIARMAIGPDAHLNLWKKHLGSVPDSVWEREDAETLVLAENGLSEISERIGRLRKLRMLDLGHNELKEVPAALGDLAGLSDFLYLHDNQLKALPASLVRLARLRYLNISENRFEELPECVCGMSGLAELRISDNRITRLPDSVRRLTRLRELHCRNNRLTSLPASTAELSELRHLDLRGNPLRELPEEMAAMPRLEKLDLRWVETLGWPKWLDDLEGRGCLVYR
jgi:Leucine-rich repeat (LRR) protein